MKKIITMLLLVAITISAKAEITKVTLQVSGLTCSMCNLSVKKSLQKLLFVQDVEAIVETATYNIKFKQSVKVDLGEIQKAVKKAGFSVADLTFTTNLNNISIPENNQIAIDGNTYNIVNPKSKKLNGNYELRIVDKDFVTDKDFKKYKAKIITISAKPSFNVAVN